MKKILLTGATGFLGRKLVKQIIDTSDFNVVAIALNESRLMQSLIIERIETLDRIEFCSHEDFFQGALNFEDVYGAVHLAFARREKAAEDIASSLVFASNVFRILSVKRLKGKERPVNSEQDRAYIISALKFVDAVVIFDSKKTPYVLTDKDKNGLSEKAIHAAQEAPMAILDLIRPDIHVKGGDYGAEDVPEAMFAKELAFVAFVEGYSTTDTIRKMTDK